MNKSYLKVVDDEGDWAIWEILGDCLHLVLYFCNNKYSGFMNNIHLEDLCSWSYNNSSDAYEILTYDEYIIECI